MALRVASVLLAIVLFAFASVECLPRNSSAKVVVVQNLTTYLMENPEVKILHPLEKNIRESPSGKQLITYVDGSRTSDDRLVADTHSAGVGASVAWGSAQDIKFTVRYPTSGEGAIVTFIRVVVEQTTDRGRAYATSGGIDQKHYEVVVEAEQTTIFSYNVEVYGR